MKSSRWILWFCYFLFKAVSGKPQVNLGLSFALVPSQEDYFISTGAQDVPKPSIFKIEPIPSTSHEISDNEPSGLLIDMGKFVKSSFDKLTNLVKPQSETTYDAPPPVKTYSLEEPASFSAPTGGSAGQQMGVFVPAPAPPSPNYLSKAESIESKWKRRKEVLEEFTKGPKAVGLSYSNIGKFQGKFNTANPQTRNKKPSNNKKKPLKKPSLKSTFAPTKEEIDRRPIVFFDITIDGVPAGTVFFELFNETVPKTAENFRILSTGERGYGYKNSVFHRIVPGYIVQGGDFTSRDGNGQMSIYGGLFEDENFLVPHDSPGMLSMANEGPDTNGSQFFITVTKLNKLDGKHVVFGRVHDSTSYELVEKINKECGREDGKVIKKVKIINTGQFR